MFSMKTDDQSVAASRAWSITARLTALFTICTSTLLLIVVGFMYEEIAKHLDEEHEYLIAEIVQVLQHSTGSQSRNVTALVEQVRTIEEDQPASYSDPYAIRVVDGHGRILAETRGIAAVPVSAFSRASVARASQRVRPQRWSSAGGETFLIATIEPRDTVVEGDKAFVQVAFNITRDGILIRQLRMTAVALLVIALIAAALAGSAVVRFSLRPVGRIASELSEITPGDLDRRLSLNDRPRELRPLVSAFNAMLVDLRHAFAGVSAYSENLAHELRTPLNNLKGEAEVALLHERSAEEYREVLMSSLEEYDRLSKMADELLFLARAESRETKPAFNELHLAGQTRAVCEFYEGLAEEENATITVDGDATVNGDAVLVRRALANLIANALAHNNDGGHVRIAIGSTAGGGASIDVTDDGSGIAAADLPHVTERFYRSATTRISGRPGSGLGLAIVKSIMDLHGGAVAIKSEPGVGTTVTLRFPAS